MRFGRDATIARWASPPWKLLYRRTAGGKTPRHETHESETRPVELSAPRFALLPLFLLAAVFSILSPLFWTHVEMPAGGPGATVYEDHEVYGRLLPAIHYGYGRMQAGEWPLWSSGQYCGTPFFANPIHGILQPLNAIFLFATPIAGLALHAFLGLFLMTLFFSLFVRALGAAYVPAALGGMVYGFCGATAVVMSRPELLGVLAWAPLLFWVVFEYSVAPAWPLVFAGGIVTALLLLSGSLALAAIIILSALVYGMVRIAVCGARVGTGRWRLNQGLMAMAGLGLVYAAVQWVPAAAWIASLDQPGEALWPRAWAGHLPGTFREIPVAMLGPHETLVPGMLYFGAIPLMLIPAALLHRQRRFEVVFFLVAAFGWLGCAVWGSTGAPGVDHWKSFVYPGVIAVAVLAGLGADRLLLAGRDPRSPLIWGSVLLAIASAVGLLAVGTPATRGPVALALVVLLPFFILRVRWLGVACGICVAFFHFVDLRGASASIYQHPHAGDQQWLRDSLPALKEAEAQALGERILTLPATRETVLPTNVGLMQPVDCAGGAYWPLTPDQREWWNALTPYLSTSTAPATEGVAKASPFYPELLNIMAVRVVVGEPRLPWIDEIGPGGRLRMRFLSKMGRLSLWKNETALERIRWVPAWQPVTGIRGAMDALLADDFSARSTCVVESEGRGFEALKSALPSGVPDDAADALAASTATLLRETPEEMEIAVKASRPGIVVVADSYDAGWRALVNGKSAPILQVNGLFRGIYVPAGDHTIVLAYTPVSVTAGLMITGIGILASIGWCLRWLVRTLYGAVARPAQTEAAPISITNFKESGE